MFQNQQPKSYKLLILLSILYNLSFNSYLIFIKIHFYKASPLLGSLELFQEFLYNTFFTFLVFLGLSINTWVLVIAIFVLFVTGGVVEYYIISSKIFPSQKAIGLILTSNFTEILEAINIKLLAWILVPLICALYCFYKYIKNLKISILVSVFSLILITFNIFNPKFHLSMEYLPFQYLYNFCTYISKPTEPKLDISQSFKFVNNSDEDLIVVLVIGEAARYDHFGINEYERDTTPFLKKIPNLFSFYAKACSNATYISVPCLLTRATTNNLSITTKEKSLISIFKSLGFYTSWIGTQALQKFFTKNNVESIHNEADFLMLPGGFGAYQMNALDESLFPYFMESLKRTGRKLIILHTTGSHWNYINRYPKQFEKFTPVCNKYDDPMGCPIISLINSYDNSIYYTDYILWQFIELLKDKNVFFTYVSDHGESLGENESYQHGGTEFKLEQYSVPFIVWLSDSFIKKHKDIYESLQYYKNNKVSLSHDYIFHSLLDCSGIQSSIINKNYSICYH